MYIDVTFIVEKIIARIRRCWCFGVRLSNLYLKRTVEISACLGDAIGHGAAHQKLKNRKVNKSDLTERVKVTKISDHSLES